MNVEHWISGKSEPSDKAPAAAASEAGVQVLLTSERQKPDYLPMVEQAPWWTKLEGHMPDHLPTRPCSLAAYPQPASVGSLRACVPKLAPPTSPTRAMRVVSNLRLAKR